MTKSEFFWKLMDKLSGLPDDELQDCLTYYTEMIDDHMENGLTEEEAVAAVGDLDDIVSKILEDIPFAKLVKHKMKPKRKRKAWQTVLLILGFPVWLPLLISAFAVALSLYMVLWSVVISFWACEVSFGACALGGTASGIVLMCYGNVPAGLVLLAGGIVCAGLSVFGFYGCKASTKGVLWLMKRMILGIKKWFVGKEAVE